MIAYIKGKILKKNATSLIMENNGLGYEIYVPANSFYKYRDGEEIELVTYLHIREDLIQLYGFSGWDEKEIFLLLINVSGVGPKGALAILSHVSIEELKAAIVTEDINVLTKLPGIGKKTAQRLIIELKDKIPKTIYNFEEVKSESTITGNAILAALVSLGYQPLEVKKIIPLLLKDYPNSDEAFLIKKALQILARI
ncbi:MAG: hypothetical protein VR72_11895 [Clostridiaceae bacterium BRH_c20a]|nr:MAG: hypothetical protein VR72_11895 [Clostridiaceae bacterium BRH_c20a]